MSYVNVNGADMGLRFDFSMSLNGNKDIEKALANIFGALDGKQIQKSIRSARSRSLKAGKELGAKLAREEYTARKAAIKKRFIATILNGGSDAGLRFSGVPGLNLIHFMARPNTDTAPRPKRGASVKVKRSGGRYVPTGKQDNSSKPFVAKIKKGGSELGVFVRYGKGKKRHMLYGPSPIQALQSPDRQEKIRERIEEVFASRLTHELDVRLQGIVS